MTTLSLVDVATSKCKLDKGLLILPQMARLPCNHQDCSVQFEREFQQLPSEELAISSNTLQLALAHDTCPPKMYCANQIHSLASVYTLSSIILQEVAVCSDDDTLLLGLWQTKGSNMSLVLMDYSA